MIDTKLGASASTGAPPGKPRTPRASHGRRWRLGITSAAVFALLLVVLIVSIFAPMTPAPDSFFHTTPVAPLGRLRTPNAHATPLATMLRQQAETQYVNALISHMTLDEELGQMIMIGFSETQMDDALAYQIQQLHVGSAI
ncbi:MAG: hypothetical protein ACRDID_16990, partial [Ktedonobacterales bacterium]